MNETPSVISDTGSGAHASGRARSHGGSSAFALNTPKSWLRDPPMMLDDTEVSRGGAQAGHPTPVSVDGGIRGHTVTGPAAAGADGVIPGSFDLGRATL